MRIPRRPIQRRATAPTCDDLNVHPIYGGDGRCSYLVWCERSRVAALIDPQCAVQDEMDELIRRKELELRVVLFSSPEVVPQRDANAAYLNLLQSLQLEAAECVPGAGPRPGTWADVPFIRPTQTDEVQPLWQAVQVGSETIEVHTTLPRGVHGFRYTLFGTAPLVTSSRVYSELRVAFGGFHIAVLLIPESPGKLAFQVADRIFTGHPFTTGFAASTPSSLLTAPDHVMLYPSRVSSADHKVLALVGQERLACMMLEAIDDEVEDAHAALDAANDGLRDFARLEGNSQG